MHDLIIVGAGPAGLSASVYASRYKINHLVFGAEVGGYLNEIHLIDNYLGFESISGLELKDKMEAHVKSLGGEIILQNITEIKKEGDFFVLKSNSGEEFQTKNVLVSSGTKPRVMEVPGEEEFRGKGVSYCATCDGAFFKNKKVVVIGGGNSAAGAALILAQHAEKVTLYYRGDKPKCNPGYLDQMEKNAKVEVVCCTNVREIKGDKVVKSIVLEHSVDGKSEVETDGVFVEIGSVPDKSLFGSLEVETNEAGFIITKPDQSTNVEGLFAAGDITTNSNCFRQIITAASEGAIAAKSVFDRLKE
jgi:thioredoxin reductase (NADPH)